MSRIDLTAIRGRKGMNLAGAILLALLVSLFLHIQSWQIADLDNLYHFRHAWIYQIQGIFVSSFSWVQYSVIKDAGADLWYGFHLLLFPFTYIQNPVWGLKIASVVVTAAGILLLFFALRRLEVRWPHFWTMVFLISSSALFYRFSALRPQLISFGLSFLFFSFFYRPTAGRYRNFLIFFLISFFTAWIHSALFWVNFVIFGTGSLVERFMGRKFRWPELWVIVGGTLAGFFLRPHPLQGLRLIYVQLIQNSLEEFKNTPLFWGTELLHFSGRDFIYQFLPIIFLLAAAIYFLIISFQKSGRGAADRNFKAQIWTAFALGAIFFWLAFASARRSADYFFGFAIVVTALISTKLRQDKWKDFKGMIFSIGQPMFLLILVVIIYMAGFSVYRYEYLLPKTYNPERAKEAAEWLRDNSQAGDIVFHTRWDQFTELFFWNQKNYYSNGMDPIFMYAKNPSLYWKQHFFAWDQASATTCGAMRCKEYEVEETYKVLKDDFRARYIYLQKERNLNFRQYLNSDPRFKKVFENNEDVIFSVD